MERLYKNILGTRVVGENSMRALTTVKGLVMDPERGTLLALVTSVSKHKVVVPFDILEWGDNVKVHDSDAIVDGDDILRLHEVMEQGTGEIFNKKVETEEGEALGRVVDFSIDGQTYDLQKLYVGKTILGMVRYGMLIIAAKNIVEILPKKIVVKAGPATVKEEAVGAEAVAA